MELNKELTIIIPAKNEEPRIGILLESLLRQDYPHIRSTRTVVADAQSTDRTREVILSFQDKLPIHIIDGGLPPISRNAGAKLAESVYLLFLDADTDLIDATLIRRGVELMKRKQLHCATAKLTCKNGCWKDGLMYSMNNVCLYFSKYTSPFSPGAFMMFDHQKFRELGGFNEKVHFSEDYYLSKQVAGKKFAVISGYYATDNRRFVKMGRLKMMRMFLNTMLHAKDDSYFYRDHKYFDQ